MVGRLEWDVLAHVGGIGRLQPHRRHQAEISPPYRCAISCKARPSAGSRRGRMNRPTLVSISPRRPSTLRFHRGQPDGALDGNSVRRVETRPISKYQGSRRSTRSSVPRSRLGSVDMVPFIHYRVISGSCKSSSIRNRSTHRKGIVLISSESFRPVSGFGRQYRRWREVLRGIEWVVLCFSESATLDFHRAERPSLTPGTLSR